MAEGLHCLSVGSPGLETSASRSHSSAPQFSSTVCAQPACLPACLLPCPPAPLPALLQVLRASLAGGTSVVLTPGGVAECFYMELEEDKEVVFLKKRTGFVKWVLRPAVWDVTLGAMLCLESLAGEQRAAGVWV